MRRKNIPTRRLRSGTDFHIGAVVYHQRHAQSEKGRKSDKLLLASSYSTAILTGITATPGGIATWKPARLDAKNAEALLNQAMDNLNLQPGGLRSDSAYPYTVVPELATASLEGVFRDLKDRMHKVITDSGNFRGVSWILFPSPAEGDPMTIATESPHTPDGEFGHLLVQTLADLHKVTAWAAGYTGTTPGTLPDGKPDPDPNHVVHHFIVLAHELGEEPMIFHTTYARKPEGGILWNVNSKWPEGEERGFNAIRNQIHIDFTWAS